MKADCGYHIDHMILFGSRARGDERLTSDVDLIVVSHDFRKIRFLRRPTRFLNGWKLPVDLEVFCYSPEEFQEKKKKLGVIREAVKYGKKI